MSRPLLPKLKFTQLSTYIMDLLLVSEGSEAHVKEPSVRRVWHLLFGSFVLFSLFVLILKYALRSLFPTSYLVAMLYRSIILAFFVYVFILLCLLVFRYYAHLLRTRKDLRFNNIIFFYLFGIILFAYLYQQLYLLWPPLFVMSNPIYVPARYLMGDSLIFYLSFFDFIVYSGTVISTLSYPRIQSGSMAVSFVNILELFYGITIITLLVATFIQKTDSKRRE